MMERIGKQNHIHKFGPGLEPCLKVDSGARLLFETLDALEGRGAEKWDPSEPAESRYARSNPATGPIYVNGAMPGDVLEVEIHDITPLGTGYLSLVKSMVSYKDEDKEPVFTEFEYSEGMLVNKGVKFPAYPMIGVIGTASEKGMWTVETGDHGANMDTSIIRKESKVLLPVFIEGAYLAMGDVHAAMGDGEVFGQGVEIDAEIDVTVRVRKDISLKRPVVITEDSIACVGAGTNMEDISYMVVKDIGNFLTEAMGLSWEEAGILIAFYGNLKICQIVNPQKTVRMEILKKYIEAIKH